MQAVMSDPAASKARAMPQTAGPLNFQRLSTASEVFLGSFSSLCFGE
jgi:hypothetical protein